MTEGAERLFPEKGLVVGVDGGGSRTRVALWDRGQASGREEGAASNPSVLGVEVAVGVVAELIERSLEGYEVHAGGAGEGIASIGVGLAGVGPRALGMREEIGKRLSERFGCPVGVWNDAEAALAGALCQGGPGVLLIGGTGSSALGFDGRSRVTLMGGWGRSLRDAGSAYELFQRFAQLLLLAEEEGEAGFERGPRDALLAELGLEDPKGLIALFARGPEPKEIEICGRVLFEAAETGDDLALELLEESGEDLLELALRCEKALGLGEPVPLFLHGGLLERDGPVRRSLERGLASREGSLLTVQESDLGAEAGAALLQCDALRATALRGLRLAFDRGVKAPD